jgi:hypothetical protein
VSEGLEPANALLAAGARVTKTALIIEHPEKVTWEQYEELARFIGEIGAAYPWWVGDVLNAGERVFGEMFAQIEAMLPHSPQTCANYKSVASRIVPDRRRELPYSIQADVAYLEPKIREELLDRAEREGWKRDQMRAAKKEIAAPVGDMAVSSSGPLASELEPGPQYCPNCGHLLNGVPPFR